MSHPALSQALVPGVKLGSFVIREVIGANRHAYTYLAYDRSLAREVIIKESFPLGLARRDIETNEVRPLNDDVAEQYEKQKQKFLDQGQKMAGLECDGVIITYGVYEALGTAYAVVAKVNGTSLEREIERRYALHEKWTPSEVKNLLTAILKSLEYLHGKKVFHHDIRPSHIWLTKNSLPILIGFDFSGPDTAADKNTVIVSTECTPPEKLLNLDSNEITADIYALGATFHKLILGAFPRRGDIRYYSEKNRRLADNTYLLENYSKTFLAGLDKALEPKKEYRFASAREWLDYLNTACTEFLNEHQSQEEEKQTVLIETEMILNNVKEDEEDACSSRRSRRKGKGLPGLIRGLFSRETPPADEEAPPEKTSRE